MSNVQNDRQGVKRMTRRAIKTSTYVMAPLMMGLAFCADSIVRVILTDKWLPCVLYMQIFCFTYMFWPIHTANLNAIKALGRSDLFLKLEIIKKIVGIVILLFTMRISVKAMAYSMIVTSILGQVINSWPNYKLLNYGYFEQIKDILPSIVLATVMGVLISLIRLLNIAPGFMLLIQMVLGVVIYIYGSYILKLESFEYLLDMIKSFIKRKEGGENE